MVTSSGLAPAKTAMIADWRRRYLPFVWLAWLWAAGNSLYVYLVLGGERTFRVESAAFILAAILLPLIFWRLSVDDRPHAVLTESENRALMLLALVLWRLALVPFVALPFFGDDYVFLASYRHVPDVLRFGQFFRPMFALVFFLLAGIAHGSPVPFHVAGFLIHATSAWFV